MVQLPCTQFHEKVALFEGLAVVDCWVPVPRLPDTAQLCVVPLGTSVWHQEK